MATGNMTVTTHARFVPEVWSMNTRDATEANLTMSSLVERSYEGEIQQFGDTVHVQDISNLTANDKAANTDVSFETVTESGVDIVVDTHKYAAIKVEDILKVQSNVDLIAKYTGKMGYALSKAVDSSLHALYAGLSQSVGSAGVDVTDANILRAIQYLDDADAPAGMRSMILKPAQMNVILSLDKFVRADAVGYLAAMSPIVTGKLEKGEFNPTEVKGYFGQIYGVAVYISTNVATSGTSPVSTHNILMHKEAFALAMQRDIRVQSDYNIRSLATEVVADVLYGVKEYRDTFGVDIIS